MINSEASTSTTPVLITDTYTSSSGISDLINAQLSIVNGQKVSAALEIRSTRGGILIPRMTEEDRDLLNPDNGLIIYNLTTNHFNFFSNYEWVDIGAGTGDVFGPDESLEGNIATFSGISGKIIKDSGVSIANVPPSPLLENENLWASGLEPGNQITISNLSFCQFLSGSGYLFLGEQAGVQIYEQPSPQNIGVLISSGDVPGQMTSASCAFELNTRNGAFLLSRMLQSDVDNLANPQNGMILYNITTEKVQVRHGGRFSDILTDGGQDLTEVSGDYLVSLADNIIAVNSLSPSVMTLPANVPTGKSYTFLDKSGDAEENVIYAVAGDKQINGLSAPPTNSLTIPISAAGSQAAITPNGNLVYVTSPTISGGGVCVVQNASSGSPEVLTNIVTGNNALGLVITRNGNFCYVCNSSANTVSIIQNASSLSPTVSGSFPITAASNIAVTPNDNYLYITGWSSNIVTVMQGASTGSPTLLTTLSVSSFPYAVAITPNGNYAYIGTQSGVTIIQNASSSNPTVLMSIPLGSGSPQISSIAITPDGNYAYVGTLSSNNVYVLRDVSTNSPSVLTSFTISATRGIAITPNGERVYIGNTSTGSNLAVIANASSGSPHISFAVNMGGLSEGVAITPNGNYAYVNVPTPENLARIQDASGLLVEIIDRNYGGCSMIFNGSTWNSWLLQTKPTAA